MSSERRFTYVDFTREPVTGVFAKSTHAIATAADNQEDYTRVGEHGAYFEWLQTGAWTGLFPTASASGWKFAVDATNGDGLEITQGNVAGNPTKMKFVTGTDAFYIKVKVECTTLANSDVFMIGFRELGTYTDVTTPALAASVYDNKALIGVNDAAGAVVGIVSNGGTDVTTTATNTPIVSGTAVTWEVRVDASRNVTYYVDGTADTLLNAAASTLTTAKTLIPTILIVGTGTATDTEIASYECGLL